MEVKQNKGNNHRPRRRDKTKKKNQKMSSHEPTKRNKNQKIGSHEPQKTNKACRQGSLIIPRYKDWLFPPIFLFFISHYLHSSCLRRWDLLSQILDSMHIVKISKPEICSVLRKIGYWWKKIEADSYDCVSP